MEDVAQLTMVSLLSMIVIAKNNSVYSELKRPMANYGPKI